MCNRFCSWAQIIINRCFTQMNIERDIWKCRAQEKKFSGAALSSLWEPSHLWGQPTKYQQDPLSIVASWKHSHKFPTLALGPAEPWGKTLHCTNSTALRTQAETWRRKETRGLWHWMQSTSSATTGHIGSHNRLLPTVVKIVSRAELPIFQKKVDIWNFMWNFVFKRLANTFWTIPNLSWG